MSELYEVEVAQQTIEDFSFTGPERWCRDNLASKPMEDWCVSWCPGRDALVFEFSKEEDAVAFAMRFVW